MNILKKSVPVGMLIIFAGSFSSIPVQAKGIPDRGSIPFAAYDKDNDGFISEEEFNSVRGERMEKRAKEGRRMRGAASAPSFSAFDTDGDGKLNKDELAAGQKAQREKRRGMGQGRGMGKGMGMGQGRGMGKGMGMGRNMPAFSEYDLNGDGKLLEKEFNEARSKRRSERAQQGYRMKNLGNAPSFADIDTNSDGEISADEFAKHQSQHRQQRAQ